MHLLPADLPFGGVGDSGMGAYHGKHRVSTRSATTRACCASRPSPICKLLYPPYRKVTERLVRKILR